MKEKNMDLNIIKSYLDADGRIIQMPAKKKKKLYILSYLADCIPENQEFDEKEFNKLLNDLHTFKDAATLRREMYINREQNGSVYTVNRNRPSAEALVEKYC